MDETDSGLGNQALLTKIDKLRELNVGSLVPLPQLVVVGDQSSGKSSVLESLTGFSFPRAAGLCTRYATQITCRREAVETINISIIPHPSSSQARRDALHQFKSHVTNTRGEDFAKIFEDANKVMGIRPASSSDSASESEGNNDDLNAFSQDILKIEINGPQQNHLTVIDVPGIFRAATPGLTTESDISLVQDMVKGYMKDPRTIILAVIPCNVDIATQEILKLAKDADLEGVRTMGVLTKPDLATERVTQQAVIDLVEGKRNDLRLGYCLVKNRGADDNKSSLRQRNLKEKEFFQGAPWSTISDNGRVGIESLKQRLRELLMDISKRELPNVKAEVGRKLGEKRKLSEIMGPSRGETNEQRLYLTRLGTRFQTISSHALNAYYTDEQMFTESPHMRLVTRIIKLNDAFSHTFATRGHLRAFHTISGLVYDDDDDMAKNKAHKVDFPIPVSKYKELHDIIVTETYDCPMPLTDCIMAHIEGVYKDSRGPELGTFNGTLLGTTFKEQSSKWEKLVLSHITNAIVLVHQFIFDLLTDCCPDPSVRNALWDTVLLDQLRGCYSRAMQHTRFLLTVEREGKPMTYNHYFNANLQKARSGRILAEVKDKGMMPGCNNCRHITGGQTMVSTSSLQNLAVDKGNAKQTCEDVHDILRSYYKVARKRFVDVVCQQVIDHYLLNGQDSPLRVLCATRVAQLSEDQLDEIAGEDAGTKRQRVLVTEEIQRLEAAMKVLRG
ncbi:uncharacterized protein E0L32_007294 [Thyridium curvatum]|uniref:Uncharacterized protein n=1 Tax=Thyridium curvatum TaxID=1093900 RepID=A0A507B4J6_9PEZI|nr:uncharacterized protein E0L32_007294 [Thyridium curvatum]TPX11991.1 hypothetical protein E0L32_007294 [Thyridium curvatum]